MDDFLKMDGMFRKDEAERADVVIRTPDTRPRNCKGYERALCANRGIAIKPRPHAPKLPMKVCIHCGLLMLDEEQASRQPDA